MSDKSGNDQWSYLLSSGSKGSQSKSPDLRRLIPEPELLIPDTRSRTERQDDFEKKLKDLDKNAIEKLKLSLAHSQWDSNIIRDVDLALEKLLKFYNDFEDLNSQESRKIAWKEKDLKVEAKYDWKAKSRLFFFRVLASVLFIVTLFTIGYIEKEYDWATLPMSKYITTIPSSVSK
ncbi:MULTISPECIES: hypothetical protein [unclassified Vibrio]|uniref:hypothetical protein n=2 Tax=Vibrio TaxID=662 RepID=UPI000B8E9467|nr:MULTISPECIES: hypothetical protein [unclassified Vibrio]NAW97339.1 hypothetical protein [Vibrio sp. V23_P3S9T160]OXX24428.1 hypothetical protein B9J88_05750 [Vibrio sp. V05_P4A8T149]OXX35655.1 hypothetical protein B9J95_01785 [Vibrio sp. V14_P6S14T42]OXX53618.1 hypothetical protein B9J91_13065 [Vibrio sp. V18_P1S4T112]